MTRKTNARDPTIPALHPMYPREHWPEAVRRRIAAFNLEAVYDYIRRAGECSGKKYFSDEAWPSVCDLRKRLTEEISRAWQAKVDLFHDVERALGEDPAGEQGQSLAARWRAQLEESSHDHPGIRAGLLKQWADRSQWSAVLRWRAEGLHMMSFDRFEKAVNRAESDALHVWFFDVFQFDSLENLSVDLQVTVNVVCCYGAPLVCSDQE